MPRVYILTVSQNLSLISLETAASRKSNASKASFRSRVAQEKAKAEETRSQWDGSVTSSKKYLSAEDKVAARIAKEVLRDNAKLRGVHSGASMQKILEKEAKKQLLLEHQEHERHEPVISTIVMEKRPLEAANLPYLHKHPAV